MKLLRFAVEKGPARWGMLEEDQVRELRAVPYDGVLPGKERYPLEQVRLLPPCRPGKIIGLGTNFKKHAAEMGKPVPDEPKIFLKPPSALIGPGDPIVLPEVPGSIEHEAEVALLIGQRARHLRPETACEALLGCTCFNDVTARALQRKDGVFARAKGFDSFAPCGPWIETDLVWPELEVESWVNGKRRQQGRLDDLIFGVPEVLAFVSSIMTLEPGDLIALGTPEGVGPLKAGDEVEIRVSAVGALRNPVIAAGDEGA